MRTKFGILWTIFVFGAVQLSHYSCADEVENQNKTTAAAVIPSASPATKAKEDTTTVTEGNISQSTSASSLIQPAETDSAKTTVNPATPTTVPIMQTDKKQQTTTSVVTIALSTSTGPPTTLPTSTSPSVTSSVTTLETSTTQNTPSLTTSQGKTQTHSVTQKTNSPKQTSVTSLTTGKIEDAHTPTTEISTASPTAGNTSPTQPQNITTSPTQPQIIATSSTQQNITTSSTQPQSITTSTSSTQPPTTSTSSTQPPTTSTSTQTDVKVESGNQDSSAILTTTPAGLTKSSAETRTFNRHIEWTDAKNQNDKNDVLLKVCWELLKNMDSATSCNIQGNKKNKNYTFTSAHVAADLSRVQQIYSEIKKSNDNPEGLHMPEVLPAILASCGALIVILLAFVLCYTCHRRLYRKNQQQLTEEMQTVENGYHDNPTLEVMEFQPEMQEKKPPLNGEFNDGWIVPIDNLPKDDFSEEEDTHL